MLNLCEKLTNESDVAVKDPEVLSSFRTYIVNVQCVFIIFVLKIGLDFYFDKGPCHPLPKFMLMQYFFKASKFGISFLVLTLQRVAHGERPNLLYDIVQHDPTSYHHHHPSPNPVDLVPGV